MIAFIGMDFAGARATSHAFFRKRSSVSDWGAAVDCLTDFLDEAEYPGGSGIAEETGRGRFDGRDLRSITH